MYAKFLRYASFMLAAIVMVALPACSTKKNNAATRQYQAFISMKW